jgi:hypothetical protein
VLKTSALLSVVLCGLVLCGCLEIGPPAPSTDASDAGADVDAARGPAQACRDLADAVAKAGVRCNDGTYQEEYQNFLANAAGGDCNNIASVRDESALRSTCIPSFDVISCTDLGAGTFDPSCQNQLQR